MSSIPTSVYAALSAAAYADFLSTANRTWASELPSGWTYLPNYSKPDTSKGLSETLGFSASTFINGKNVVISFEGTDLSELGDAGKTAFDLLADIGLGLGSSLGLPQLVQAALVYEAVRKEYPADEDYSISFTGHSLGAGLASIMAVWFDQPATVFNDAPFLATADSTALATATNLALLAQGYNDQAFSDFLDKATLNNDLAGVTSRESLVNAYYTQGEVLNKRFGFAGNSGCALWVWHGLRPQRTNGYRRRKQRQCVCATLRRLGDVIANEQQRLKCKVFPKRYVETAYTVS